MLSEVLEINPSEKAEDRPPSNSSKSMTLNTGNKIHKSKIPKTQPGRGGMQGDSAIHQTSEESGIIPNNNPARRPNIKSLTTSSPNRKLSTATPGDKRQLEIQYSTKRMRYINLKKTLIDKQKTTQDLHDEISSLREKIIAAGGKDPGKIEELRLSQLECYPKQGPLILMETNPPHDLPEQQICMDESTVMNVTLLQNQLQDLFDRSQELCQHLLDRSTTLAVLIKSWLTGSDCQNETGNVQAYHSEMSEQLPILEQDNENLQKQLNELKTFQDDIVAEFTKRSSSLRNEYQNYRERIKQPPNTEQKDIQSRLSVALEELRAERDKANEGKERMRLIESQMQKARMKIRELQGQMTSEETKSQQLQNNVRFLESQLKQKDQAMENKIKDMQKAMKSNDGLVTKIEKQRDTFESRILELKEKMASKETEANAIIKQLSEKCEIIDKKSEEEREKRLQTENSLAEMEQRCKHLEEKSQLLCKLADEKSNNLTVTDDNHTQNEIRLYNDLKAVMSELEKQTERIEQLEREKQEIVAVMHQAASLDNDDETRDRLAAELVAKTKDLQNLTLEHAQLQRIARLAQEKNEVLENQLTEIQRNLHAKSMENGKMGLDPYAIELQQQISDLRNNLAEVIQHNQQLEVSLTQKQLELEQRDRMMREQSKFLKVRNELQNLLKGAQQTNADSPLSENDEHMDEINKQIAAKTEAIQELYATLEGKQMQVMRLEKLVKLLEDQQDRAQAQRTRLEHRIGQLEISLREKNKNSNRYVMRRYSRKLQSNSDENKRAVHCESVSESSTSKCSCSVHSRQRSEPFDYRYCHVSLLTKNTDYLPRRINMLRHGKSTKSHTANDRYLKFSNKKEMFLCEHCRREEREKHKDNIYKVYQTKQNYRDPVYGWLMKTSALEAFGEPKNRLNNFNNKSILLSGSRSKRIRKIVSLERANFI